MDKLSIYIMRFVMLAVPFVAAVLCRADGLPVPMPAPGDSVRVSLLTAAPGSIIYELEGHSMLRVRYGDYDFCLTWGVFDFNESDFVYRFVKGETDYMVACFPTAFMTREYAMTGRRVTEQVLNLNRNEALKLLRLADINLQSENVKYRYNYVYDNCATRPLHFIQEATGSRVDFSSFQRGNESETFRSMMRGYHRNYPWYQFGIDLALGSGIDFPVTREQSAFAPVRLMEMARVARMGDRPLVAEERMMLPGDEEGTQLGPTPWYLTPMSVCTVLAVIGLAFVIRAGRRRGVPKVLTSIFFGLEFVLSLLLTFLIFVSSHEATSPNWLYLWLNPLAIIPAAGVWLKNCNRVLICYHFLNFAAILALVCIGVAGVQGLNPAFYPLMALSMAISAEYITVKKWTNAHRLRR